MELVTKKLIPSGNYIPYTGYDAVKGYSTNSSFTIQDGTFTNSLGRGTILIQNRITSNIYTKLAAGPTNISFITPSDSAQVDLSSINKWNDVSTTVQSNSAQWAEGGGSNPEVESYVINNSATIDEVNTTYQSNSANYLTAHQSLTNYYTTAEANTLSSMLSGAIDYVSANAGGSVPVSNSGDLYKVEFDGVDLYGYKKTTTIPAEPFYSAVSSQESNYIHYTTSPQWNSNAIYPFDWIGFDIITVSSDGNEIRPVGYPYGVTALNVYYLANYVYDSNNNQLPSFSGYIGKIKLNNLFISSYIDKPSYFNDIARCDSFKLWFSGNQYDGQINNHYICSVGSEVRSDPETVEGIFVPSSTDLSNYYTKSETSGASEIADALPTYEYDNTNKISAINGSAIAAGDEFPVSADEAITAYQTNSATYLTAHQAISADEWNNCYDNVNTNSGSWGGSALPISAGPGIKVNLVDNTLVFSNDETVLYSGQSTGNLTLSDSPLNYERLLVTFNATIGNNDMGAGSEIIEPDKTHIVCLHNYFMYQTTQTAFSNMNEAWAVYSGVDTTEWTRTIGGWRNGATYTSTLNDNNDFLKVSKVIGINRKQ